ADGKKGGAVRQGTPYPKGGKTPASGGKSNKSLKSTGSVSCDSCIKAFGTDSALQGHSNAKHNKLNVIPQYNKLTEIESKPYVTVGIPYSGIWPESESFNEEGLGLFHKRTAIGCW
ncbi:hypothetical protein MKW98_026956, partial [Papaver atlanticum]